MPPPPERLLRQRRLGFLLWQSTSATALYLLLHLLTFTTPSSPLPFLLLHLSSLILSLALHPLSLPHPQPHAPLHSLAAALLSALLRVLVGGFQSPCWDAHFRRRAGRTLAAAAFLAACGLSGFLGMAGVGLAVGSAGWWVVAGFGVRGLVVGLLYGAWYLYWRRWLLRFPLVQRPLFFSLKIGFLFSFYQAIRLLLPALLFSIISSVFLPDDMKVRAAFWWFLVTEIRLCMGTSIVIFSWEVSHNLLQVVYTRRSIFAPSQGSAAAESNPSEPLLECLEQCNPRSLLQYLAYLDLCIVAESNVELWRKHAFFEETGDTYRRIISSCMRPLEQLTSRIAEVLEIYDEDKSGSIPSQLTAATDPQMDTRLYEAFDDFQLCYWSSRAAATLTSWSHNEDRFGVAQLSGCNASVVTMLLSCLLAVEACMGKKTSLSSAHTSGPGTIRWATPNAGKILDAGPKMPRKRSVTLHAKAYAMADVLRTSLYEIISTFEGDMHANLKASVLDRNWITESKPLFGTKEVLVQKLLLFLEFQAC